MKQTILLCLLSFSAYAAQTPRLIFTAPGQSNVAILNSGSQAYQIANNGTNLYNSPCMPGTPSTMPAFRFTGGLATFKTNLKNYSYPSNVAITRLDVRICAVRIGTTASTIRGYIVYRRISTGSTYYALGTPPQVLPGTYNDASAVAFGPVTFMFSAGGSPNINSMDLDDVEFGFVGDADPNSVFRIVGVDIKATFSQTPLQQTIAPVTSTYTPNSTLWNNGVVTLDETLPNPSSLTGSLVKIRCGNGSYRQIAQYNWGFYTPTGHQIQNFPLYNINAVACAGVPLYPGALTNFSVQPLNGGTPFGNITYTSLMML